MKKRSFARKLVTIFAAVLVPAAFFVLLEVGLRAAGYGVNTDLVLELKNDPTHTCYLNINAPTRYFPPALRSIQPGVGFRTFTREKEPGALRVFVLGASTVAGFPFHVNGSFAGFLEDDLRAAYPGRRIEVINCGMTAICSYSVLDFAKQLVKYQPDLFLIYLGHNEFYGTLGAGSTSAASATRGITLFRMTLAKLRTYQLLDNTIYRVREMFAKKDKLEGHSLMAAMIGKKKIRLEDPLHRMAEAAFRANINDMLDVAEKNNVKVIISTLTSNLRDLPPFDSAHRDGIDDIQRQTIDAAIRDGDIAEMRAAVQLDTTYAATHFALARALAIDTTATDARREYIAARDHDVVHFRACSRFNDIIREVASAHHTPLVDMDAVFAAHSPEHVPGINLFLEHLHPNLRGAILMASAFRDAMRHADIIPPSNGETRSYAQAVHDACITPLDLELARQRLESMTSQWPFQHDYAPLARDLPPQPEIVARYAERVLHRSMGLDQAHQALGTEYLKARQLEPALEEFRALAKIYPVSPVGHITAADILLRLHRPAEAIPYYQTGLALAPNDVEPRWRYAFALHAVGDNDAALAECKRILARQPGHRATLELMQRIQSGQP
ncbi:MAG TPA: tetratricopeptide repeat protein [Candidatus Krumholzibacteria bacterium]|nr:tetratricopeptide repeat protein [Candidatus Krumholzibacteria bacterium]